MAETLTFEQAVEALYEDERLRSELTDSEATILLDWGVAELKAAQRQRRSLATTLGHVRATARRVNELVRDRDSLTRDSLAARCRALAGLPAPTLPGFVRRAIGQRDVVDHLIDRLPGLERPAFIRALLQLANLVTRPQPAAGSRTARFLLLILLLGGLVLAVVILVGSGTLRQRTVPSAPAESTGAPEPARERPGRPTVSTGLPVDVYFTTPRYPDRPAERRGGLDERLVAIIGGAQRSIDMAAYDLDLPNVATAMLDARRRGLRVRLVTDSDNVDNAAVQRLRMAGVPIVEDRRRAIMHHKFVVIDDSSVWMGSWNFTTNDTYRYNNNGVYWRDQRLAENFAAEFDKLFGGQFGPTKPRAIPYPVIMRGESRVETYFASEHDPTPAIVQRLQGAQQSIVFMAFSFTHDPIGSAIIERSRRGVKVQGVFETTGSETQFSEFGRMRAAKMDVLADGNPYLMHHKVIVVDERTVIFGSFNFTSNAASDNDESCLIVDDVGLARLFVDEFARVRQVALTPPVRR